MNKDIDTNNALQVTTTNQQNLPFEIQRSASKINFSLKAMKALKEEIILKLSYIFLESQVSVSITHLQIQIKELSNHKRFIFALTES